MQASWQAAGLALAVGFLALPAELGGAEFAGEQAVRDAARNLLPRFAAQPVQPRSPFAASYLQHLDANQIELAKIFQGLHAQHGRAEELRLLRMIGPYAADIEFVFAKGVRTPARLGVEVQPPHLINGLVFQEPITDQDSLEAIVKDLKSFPGEVGFLLQELPLRGEGAPRTIGAYRPDHPLAVASSMKLIVLAALAEEIAAKKRAWSDVVQVKRTWASLPAGVVQDWPDGAPVTLHTLATLMISRSDNTAADHLIRVLGRERIEAAQKTLGLQADPRNEPFLLTGEMFKLKLVMTPAERDAYVQADSAGRRKLLETTVAQAKLDQPRGLGLPQAIEQIEWFCTSTDLCKLLDRLRRTPELKELLTINRGLSLDESQWTTIGFKGGAEPGVLNFSVLLQDHHGRWFAFVIGWNNPKADVDRTQLVVFAQRLLRLARK